VGCHRQEKKAPPMNIKPTPMPQLKQCPRGCMRIKIMCLGAPPGRPVFWAECECDWTGPRRATARWAALAWNRRLGQP
jgi:hypothetical protein